MRSALTVLLQATEKNWCQQKAKIMQMTGKFMSVYEYIIHHIL